MADAEYVGGNTNQGYQIQDVIRTLNISFQPYMPFTQMYAMGLTSSQDPNKANYFRIGPPSIQATRTMGGGSDSSYPFKLRRELFGGDAGSATGKITNVATKNPDRLKNMTDAYGQLQDAQNDVSDLGRELAGMLSASYAFDKDAFIRKYTSPTSSRNTHEIELSMLSRKLDELSGDVLEEKESPLRDRSDFIFTTKTGQGFDILLSSHRRIASYIDHLYGRNITKNIEGLEVSKGKAEKVFFDVDIEGLEENAARKVVTNRINSLVDSYNMHINNRIAPQMKMLREAGVAPEKAFAFEAARESFEANMDKRTHQYMIRQMTDRFLINNFKPYLFQGQISNDSFGIFVIHPTMRGDIPQLQRVKEDEVRIVTSAPDMFVHMQQYGISQLGISASAMDSAVNRIKGVANVHAMARNVITSVNSYASAAVEADINNNLDLEIGTVGLGSVNRVAFDIAGALHRDIKAHFNTSQMQSEFKGFYQKMMKKANDLTKKWYDVAKGYEGVRGKPISMEWRAPTYGWNKGNDFKKKDIGVWSSPRYTTWKEDMGRNFSIAPFFESRRRGTGGAEMASRFTNTYNEY